MPEPAKLPHWLTKPLIAFAVALLVRFAYLLFLLHSEPAKPAAHFYYGGEVGSIAASVAQGHGFSSPLSAPSGPTAWTTPVYPCLLAAVFKLFGVYTVPSNLVMRALDILFSALTCFPIYFLARKALGITTAAVAAWIWTFIPPAVYFPVVWVWDMSLTALVLTWSIWAAYEVQERLGSWTWIRFGALWGVAVLINAAVLPLFPCCLLFALYRQRIGVRNLLRPSLNAALGLLLVLTPWIIRNQVLFKGQVVLRSNFGLELWLGNNPEVPDTWSWWLHPTGSRKEYERFFQVGETAYMQEKKEAALQFMKTHPVDVARFQFHRFLQTWTGKSDSFWDIWSTGRVDLRAELLANYALTLLMLAGLLLAYRRSPLPTAPMLAALVIFPIPYYICHTDPRYRHPIDPVIVIMAAY